MDAFELWDWRRLLRVPWTARRSNQSIHRRSVLSVHWKHWSWNWNSNTLATSCKEQTHWGRHWCWERLKAGGEGDDRRWDGWMVSLTQWTWVWVNYRSWGWTGRPGVLQSMGSQRVRHNWATELNTVGVLFRVWIPYWDNLNKFNILRVSLCSLYLHSFNTHIVPCTHNYIIIQTISSPYRIP